MASKHYPSLIEIANAADAIGPTAKQTGTGWVEVTTGNLTVGKKYELLVYSTVTSDVFAFWWLTQADGTAPGATIGRECFLHSPIVVVPTTGHVRVFVKAQATPTSLGDGGYYAALVPCE